MLTGRRLAKVPSALRRPSSPLSGRTLASGADHFGPPIAPSRMASAARQDASVASGSGWPVRSMAAPPKCWCESVNWCPKRCATACRQRTPSAATSGPMPSPPSTVMEAFIESSVLAPRLVGGDAFLLLQQEAQFIDAVQQAVAGEGVDRETHADAGGERQGGAGQVDLHLAAGIVDEPAAGGLIHHDGQQSVLQRIVAEDIGDLGADDGVDAVVQQRPGGVFTRGAATEVAARDQHLAAASRALVEDEVGFRRAVGRVAPVGKQLLTQSVARGGGEKARRNDLVGVDIAGRHYHRARADRTDPVHHSSSRGSVTRPRIALAAAVSGLASSVRAPAPWRPSKLRLLVLTEYSPRATVSPFMPMHIEQPDSRHSAPAAMKIRSSPSASAAALTCWEPGTTSMRTELAILRPRSSCAAPRRSLRRPLVQLPMNTTLTGWSRMAWPA